MVFKSGAFRFLWATTYSLVVNAALIIDHQFDFTKRVKTLSNLNLIASRHIEREKRSLPVNVRLSKTSLIKLPNYPRDRAPLTPNIHIQILQTDLYTFPLRIKRI